VKDRLGYFEFRTASPTCSTASTTGPRNRKTSSDRFMLSFKLEARRKEANDPGEQTAK
jgi:hypothetical protein